MTKCRVCGRILKRAPWSVWGIGPICAKRGGIHDELGRKLDGNNGDQIVPYDGGDIWIERLSAETVTGQNMQTEMLKHSASGCRTNVPAQILTKSPSGFNFGYGGSGPSEFARNICLLFCKHADDAYAVFQDFKWKFVAVTGEDPDRLVIPRAEIEQFLTERGIELK